MKVLTLQGSAKKRGNTATVLGWVNQELLRLGHEVENISLQDKDIRGCLACDQCKTTAEEVGCIQEDDAIAILDKIVEADLVLYTSPLYFWGLAGPLKSLIDRTYSLYTNYHKPDHQSLIEGKRHALLVTGGGPYENNAEPVFVAFKGLSKPHKTKRVGELYLGSCSVPEELDNEVKDQALSFARQIVK